MLCKNINEICDGAVAELALRAIAISRGIVKIQNIPAILKLETCGGHQIMKGYALRSSTRTVA